MTIPSGDDINSLRTKAGDIFSKVVQENSGVPKDERRIVYGKMVHIWDIIGVYQRGEHSPEEVKKIMEQLTQRVKELDTLANAYMTKAQNVAAHLMPAPQQPIPPTIMLSQEPAKPAPISQVSQVESNQQKPCDVLSVHDLMATYLNPVNEKNSWANVRCPEVRFQTVCAQYNKEISHQTAAKYNRERDFGYVEKLDLPPGSRVFSRADIHGDLKSLLEDLQVAQQQGLLDANYHVTKGSHLLFLGDYGDRGKQSMEVLELIMRLKTENPDAVHLIRGNHENVEQNVGEFEQDTTHDPNFAKFLRGTDQPGVYQHWDIIQSIYASPHPNFEKFSTNQTAPVQNWAMLQSFYESLPLACYICQGEPNQIGKQYIQYSHAALEPTVDLAPFLAGNTTSMPIPMKRALSDRIAHIAEYQGTEAEYKVALGKARTAVKESTSEKKPEALNKLKALKLSFSAKVINELLKNWASIEEPLSTHLWGDFIPPSLSGQKPPTKTRPGKLEERQWMLSPRDVKHYFRLATDKNPVKMMFRGHQHYFRRIETGKKYLGETLPVSLGVAQGPKPEEVAYIFTVAPEAKNWKKTPLLRVADQHVLVGKPIGITEEPPFFEQLNQQNKTQTPVSASGQSSGAIQVQ